MRRAWRVGAGLVVLAAGSVLALGWKASSRAMHPAPAAVPWSLADHPGLTPADVRVRGAGGLELAGRFFPGRTRATVVLSHGYGANQDELLPVVQALHDGGLSTFTYDMRGTGATGGAVTFGTLEQRDLRAVIDALVQRPDVDPERIGAYGFSLGGAITLMTAAQDERIRTVVADSAWSDVDHWLRPRLSDLLHPKDPFSPVSLRLVELRTPADLDDLHPRSVVARISPRPVLFLHGTADTAVPAHDSELNYAAAGEPKQLWLIPGEGHGDSLKPGGAASSQRMVQFLRTALSG